MVKKDKAKSELSNLDLSEDDAGVNPETLELKPAVGPATTPETNEIIGAEETNPSASESKTKTQEDGIPRHAPVLTGGIDSTVMLYMINETLCDRFDKYEIYPIMLVGEGQDVAEAKKKIQIHLDRLGIKPEIKVFKLGPKSQSIEQVLQWCQANEIPIIDFAATGEESEANIPGKNFADYQAMNDLNKKVSVYTPLITVAKKDIIQWAVDKYCIDIETETVPPYFPKGPMGDANRKLREKGFNSTWSNRLNKWIEDPHKPKPKPKKEEQK